MNKMREIVQRFADPIFITLGIIFLFLLTPVLLREHYPNGYTLTSAIHAVMTKPAIGIPAYSFGLLGVSLIITGIRGLFHHFASPEQRVYGLMQTNYILFVVASCMAVLIVGMSQSMAAIEPKHLRICGIVIGLIATRVIIRSMSVAISDAGKQWTYVAGGLIGYGLGPLFYILLLFLLVVFVIQPVLQRMPLPLVRLNADEQHPGPTPAITQADVHRIAQIRKRIAYLEIQTNLPPDMVQKEIARLNNELRVLGAHS